MGEASLLKDLQPGTKYIAKTKCGYVKMHRNPSPFIKAPHTMMWRKRSEGLKYTCKGKKVGSGGTVAHFFVAVSNNFVRFHPFLLELRGKRVVLG